jgi:hypothetical protein
MKKRFWAIGLLGVALLMASCGTPDSGLQEDASVTKESPTEVVTSSHDVRRISPVEAIALADEGAAVLYDTRSTESFASAHAEGAISYPEAEAAGRIGELPTDKALIFYCT